MTYLVRPALLAAILVAGFARAASAQEPPATRKKHARTIRIATIRALQFGLPVLAADPTKQNPARCRTGSFNALDGIRNQALSE